MADVNNPLNLPIFFSQSGVSTDWQCPRKRYYSNEYEGQGLSGVGSAIYLFIGTSLHDGLAAIAAGLDIDTIAEAAREQIFSALTNAEYVSPDEDYYAREQAALVEGLLRGYHKHVWPGFKETYTIVATERELLYRYGKGEADSGLAFMSKPDLIVRDKAGDHWYVEYKSTGKADDKWVNSWSSAVQLHSGVYAVKQMLGIDVAGVIVQGLYKGYAYQGKQGSPFCYAYHKPAEPPFTEARWSPTYKPGYKKFPIWEKPGGVKEWVNQMPSAVLAEQFPQVPPIFVNNDLINTYFDQREMREREIALATRALLNPETNADTRKVIMDMTFPQRFDQCSPSFGSPCPYKKLCFSPMADDPIAAGFTLRDNTHRLPFYKLINEAPLA